jgi:hypothetical protein
VPSRRDQPQPAEWFRAYAQVQARADREVLAALRTAYIDLTRQIRALLGSTGLGDQVRLAQLLVVRRAMLEELAKLYAGLGNIIAGQQYAAGAAAVGMGEKMNAVLFAASPTPELATALADGLLAGLADSIDVMVTRMSHSRTTLSQRIYNSELWARGQVESVINSALARGLSAREFAAEARALFNPNTPGGIRFASMRLARTEINNAYHATNVLKVADAPWVTAMQWLLSRSHPKADDCDTLATQDAFGVGSGKYPPRDVPRKPHPQCFCCVVPSTVDEDTFLDNLVKGNYDSYITRTTGV